MDEDDPGSSQEQNNPAPISLREMTQAACVATEYHHLACSVRTNNSTPPTNGYTSIDVLEMEAYDAIVKKHLDRIRQVLDGGLKADHMFSERVSPTITNETLLQVMVKEGFDDGVVVLFERAGLLTGPAVQMAFLYAMRHNMNSMIRLFLQAVVDETIHMDLADAFRHGMYKAQYDLVAKIIQKSDFNVNLEATWGLDKPLHIVNHHSQVDLVKMLLEKNALVDAMDRKGTTPLIISCSFGSLDCIRLLLIHGANPNHKACKDLHPHHSPLHAAYRFFFLNPDNHAEHIVSMLLRSGLNMQDESWILTANSGLSVINKDLTEFLQHLGRQPQELKLMCSVRIRRILSKNSHGSSILQYLNMLPIPPGTKHWLKMDDI